MGPYFGKKDHGIPDLKYNAVISCALMISLMACCEASMGSQGNVPGNVRYSNPALEDVQAAINSARPGDTVFVRAGTATWEKSSPAWAKGCLHITKGIKLIGAGIGKTIITSNYVAQYSDDPKDPRNFLITYNPTDPSLDSPFRVSGFTFDFAHKSSGIEMYGPGVYLTYVDEPQTKIRIDHNRFINATGGFDGWNIFSKGPFYGCIDNNIFSSGGINFNGTNGTQWGSSDPRVSTFDYGSPYNMYVEDNSFTVVSSGNILLIYGCDGGRYCLRYNTITSTGGGVLKPFCDMHGNQEGSSENGTFGAEIYENTIICPEGYIADHRGGKLLCYNNHGIVTLNNWYSRVTEEHCDYAGPSPSVSATSGQHQYPSDSYYWGNTKTYGGVTGPLSEYMVVSTHDYTAHDRTNEGVVPRKDVHFWPESTESDPYTFNGSRGVGSGLLSARPSSGLKVGVGYWATDTKTLYRATSSTTWEIYYTPYTYPHPLRSSATLGD